MSTAMTSKGQVTIPKWIHDALHLEPGARVEFAVNASGEIVLRRAPPASGRHRAGADRFDAVRGTADVNWRTDDPLKLLRD